jgi:hypothetical protein
MDVIAELDAIIRDAQDAIAALADEHESLVRANVKDINDRAHALYNLVTTW